MSFLRDLVTGDNCEADVGASSSSSANPLRNMASTFLGDSHNALQANEMENLLDDNIGLQQRAKGVAPFAQRPPAAQLTAQQQLKVRSRSEMLARHLVADKGEKAVEQQAEMFLNAFHMPLEGGVLEGMNRMNFSHQGRNVRAQKFTLSDDIDLAEGGNEENLAQDMDNMLDDFQNVDTQAAYAKYLDYMKQTLSLDHIQKTTEEYKFSVTNNPFVEDPKAFETGVQLWKQGDLIKAVSAFEAVVFHNKQNADAWRMLGVCHAECDDDTRAINALAHAVDVDPNHLNALLDLGVCYTNELNKMRALVYLKTWLQHHPSYAHLVEQFDAELKQKKKDEQKEEDMNQLYNYFHMHQEVTSLFVKASQQSQDADLFSVLGVLFNISHDYENATQSFQTAVKLRPTDYSLWNKLGATQANSARSDEAVHCYHQALKLKPNYVRAWINLGIAYANQKQYPEAVKFYLRSLNMCPKADNVWQYLSMAFTCMDRQDLVEMCKYKDVMKFKPFFQF